MGSAQFVKAFLALNFPNWELSRGIGTTETSTGQHRTTGIRTLVNRNNPKEWKVLCTLTEFSNLTNSKLEERIRQLLSD